VAWQLQPALAHGGDLGGAQGRQARVALPAEEGADLVLCPTGARRKQALQQAWRRARRRCRQGRRRAGQVGVLMIVSIVFFCRRAPWRWQRLKRCWSDGVDS
jgi:hypothetical protein